MLDAHVGTTKSCLDRNIGEHRSVQIIAYPALSIRGTVARATTQRHPRAYIWEGFEVMEDMHTEVSILRSGLLCFDLCFVARL